MTDLDLTRVRATINMIGVRAGDIVLVDASKPAIAELLEAGFLVREGVYLNEGTLDLGLGEGRGGAGAVPALTVVEDVEEDSPPEAA